MNESAAISGLPRSGLLRRLGALLYDALLLTAVWMIGTAVLLPLTGGEAIEGVWRPLFQLYIVGLTFGFFALFWIRGGQTLGMKAWRIRVQRPDGSPLELSDALRRFLFAAPAMLLGGIGLLWLLFDRDRLALHDRLSQTEVVLVPAS